MHIELQFEAEVRLRSSRPGAVKKGPAGEAELLQLNPQRLQAIRQLTGWSDVYPGTLNLQVNECVLDELLSIQPGWFEPPETIRHPSPKIPFLRGGYLYYTCRIKNEVATAAGLLRRPRINPIAGRLEVFGALKLRDVLQVDEHDFVVVTVRGPSARRTND
jgi:CTP-dependent riboflavin kinase